MNRLIPMDSNGEMGSVAQKVPSEKYQVAISQIINDILDAVGNESIRSIVLRGSVACHWDIPGISDLDLVIFPYSYSDSLASTLAELAAKETAKWKALIPLVDLSCEDYSLLTTEISHNRLYLNLKLMGITVWGEDVISSLPVPICDFRLAKRIYLQTVNESKETMKMIQNKEELSYMGEKRGCDFLCVWFMRSFSRGLIAPVMLKSHVFSLNVQSCVRLFNEAFPHHANLGELWGQLECNPTSNWDELKNIAFECLNIYEEVCNEVGLSQ